MCAHCNCILSHFYRIIQTVEAMSAVVEGIQHKETRKKNDKFKSLGEFYETKIKKKGDRKDEQFRRQLSIYNDYWHREVQTQEGCDNWHQVRHELRGHSQCEQCL